VNFNIIGAVILLAAAGGWLLTHDVNTVKKERARVTAEATKKDEKARTARQRVDAAPVAGVLDKWWRD